MRGGGRGVELIAGGAGVLDITTGATVEVGVPGGMVQWSVE